MKPLDRFTGGAQYPLVTPSKHRPLARLYRSETAGWGDWQIKLGLVPELGAVILPRLVAFQSGEFERSISLGRFLPSIITLLKIRLIRVW